MKKRIVILLTVVMSLMLTACTGGDGDGESKSVSDGSKTETLKVYNAGEYVDTDVLRQFEEEYNCKIIYDTFESNEVMYTKISSGESYDIIIPSDYMIERLIKEDLVMPVDWSLITNKEGLMPEVMDLEFDPGNTYSVPYFWGTVGILYDTTVVAEADLADGWNLLMNEKYAGDLYMYDSERDSFMVALKSLGYSMNTDNKDEIQEAFDWLVNQKSVMSPIYAGDDVIDNMISGNKSIAVVYSGDAAYIMTENEDLDYLAPEEGTNVWYDGMVITNDCKNIDLAHKFMDFMLREDVALANTEAVGYTSPVASAFEKMKTTTFAGISAYVPDTTNPNNEIFRYQEQEIKELFAELWTKVKAQ